VDPSDNSIRKVQQSPYFLLGTTQKRKTGESKRGQRTLGKCLRERASRGYESDCASPKRKKEIGKESDVIRKPNSLNHNTYEKERLALIKITSGSHGGQDVKSRGNAVKRGE